MDTNIPVTEAEMTGFFARVTTSFVSLSRQAAELEEVKRSVASMYEQIERLQSSNATLHKERDDALTLAVENENKLNDARRHRDDLEHRVNALNASIIGRDSEVNELRGLLTSARLAEEDARRACEYKDRQITELNSTLSQVRERRDSWMIRAEDAEKGWEETKAKLKAIEDTVSSVFPHLKQALEVPAKADPIADTANLSEQSSGPTAEPPQAPKPWWETPVSEQKVG